MRNASNYYYQVEFDYENKKHVFGIIEEPKVVIWMSNQSFSLGTFSDHPMNMASQWYQVTSSLY